MHLASHSHHSQPFVPPSPYPNPYNHPLRTNHPAYNHHYDKENDSFSLALTPAASVTSPYQQQDNFQIPGGVQGHYSGHWRNSTPLISPQPVFAASPFPIAPASTGVLADLISRLDHLQQDNARLRQSQAEQRAELNVLREIIVHRTEAADSAASHSSSNMWGSFLDVVKGDRGLLPGEEPGTDRLRYSTDFPKVKFWQQSAWNDHEKTLKGSVQIGQVVGVKGKSRSAQGENVSCLFVEDANGVPVDGHYIRRAREFATNFLDYLKAHTKNVGKWEKVDIRAREAFIDALRRKFPEFQVCEDNWKGHQLMKSIYYDRVARPPRTGKPKQESADLEDAKYVLDATSPLEVTLSPEVSTHSPIDPKTSTLPQDDQARSSQDAAPTTSDAQGEHPDLIVPTLKRPCPTPGPDAAPSKRPNLTVDTTLLGSGTNPATPGAAALTPAVIKDTTRSASLTVSDDTPNEGNDDACTVVLPKSVVSKGKDRVRLRVAANLVHNTVPVAMGLAVPASTAAVDISQSSSVGGAESATTAPISAQAANDCTSGTSTSLGAGATSLCTPPASSKVKAGPSGNSNAQPKIKTLSRQWPPPPSETQLKYVYAREDWCIANPQGTLAEFEKHYTGELSRADKQKLGRRYKVHPSFFHNHLKDYPESLIRDLLECQDVQARILEIKGNAPKDETLYKSVASLLTTISEAVFFRRNNVRHAASWLPRQMPSQKSYGAIPFVRAQQSGKRSSESSGPTSSTYRTGTGKGPKMTGAGDSETRELNGSSFLLMGQASRTGPAALLQEDVSLHIDHSIGH
ncbi:hypothetical protein BN946_scf184874.g2 [Trametes cinnabarina]|uniref:Uncharacterized protein n=1 Tax=Pycnoporus cinnabarinus TaxID=5643 RepID=A0A060SKB2_PYCCI|nr:hypothetical protein BN946_scf184874.g2 [Trametes cinnabarina]